MKTELNSKEKRRRRPKSEGDAMRSALKGRRGSPEARKREKRARAREGEGKVSLPHTFLVTVSFRAKLEEQRRGS